MNERKKLSIYQAVVAYTFNPNTWEAVYSTEQAVQEQPGLHRDAQSTTTNKIKYAITLVLR